MLKVVIHLNHIVRNATGTDSTARGYVVTCQDERLWELILLYESIESEFINRLLPMLLRIKAAPELLQDPIRKFFETSICWLPGGPICEIRRMFKCEFRLSAICKRYSPKTAARDTEMARAAENHEYRSHQVI